MLAPEAPLDPVQRLAFVRDPACLAVVIASPAYVAPEARAHLSAWGRERRHGNRAGQESPPRGPRQPGDRPLRGHRRPGQAQAAAGDVPPRPGRADAGARSGSSAPPATRSTSRSSASSPARRSRLRPRGRCDRATWDPLRRLAALRRRRRRLRARSARRSRRPATNSARTPASSSTSRCRRARAAATVEAIGELGLGKGARVITEKPFGTDLASARKLNALLHSVFDERCIYRIDHYLGREAVQNLLALRFANGMFEPVWNRNHIDHVQIDIPETLSIEMRGSFYEETGAFRDMVVTHLFQVLGFVAMEPPTSLEPKALGLEREKVFDSMPPLRARGRRPRPVRRLPRRGGRRPRLGDRDLRRRQGLRRQLALGGRAVLPALGQAPGAEPAPADDRLRPAAAPDVPARLRPDRRVLRPRPPHLRARRPRQHLRLLPGQGPGADDASSARRTCSSATPTPSAAPRHALDAYERLIHDVMVGDRTLFTSSDAIERLWEISEPVLENPPPVARLRARLLGPGGERRPDRAAPLAPAQRPRLSRGTEKGPVRGPLFPKDVPPASPKSLARRSSSFEVLAAALARRL